MIVWLAWFSTIATACGPDFPVRALSDRGFALLHLTQGTFTYDATRLVDPPDSPYPTAVGTRADQERAGVPEGMLDAPLGLQTYRLAATAWHAGDHDTARKLFEAVLALPPADRPLRGIWARYSLARMLPPDQARAHYQQIRQEVRAGAPDPMGLALASLGEEARTWLETDRVRAVRLYAEQAAHHDPSAIASLSLVARRAALDPSTAELRRYAADPAMRRLILAHVWSRYRAPLAARWIDVLEAAGVRETRFADRIAAVSYREGQYTLAARYVRRSSSPLADWIGAKLALRRGDEAAALAGLHRAIERFGPDVHWDVTLSGGEGGPGDAPVWTDRAEMPVVQRIWSEIGVLHVARGAYVEGLAALVKAVGERDSAWAYGWEDAAHVADRLLTIDELQRFLGERGPSLRPFLRERLAAVLARRLMRAERYDEALATFENERVRDRAAAYVAARERVDRAPDDLTRAQAWLEAAAIAEDSLKVFGTEGRPDYVVYDGHYRRYNDDPDKLRPPSDFAAPAEAERYTASATVSDDRFHYRHRAVDHALTAADLLPTHSVAFAAALCRAWGYIERFDRARANQFYLRYLQEGPLYEGSGAFGKSCPDPDLEALIARGGAPKPPEVRPSTPGFPWGMVGAGVVVALGGALGFAFALRNRR